MESTIKRLKLKEWTENDIYKNYLHGKSMDESNFGEEVDNFEINNRVEYLTKLTETYLDCW